MKQIIKQYLDKIISLYNPPSEILPFLKNILCFLTNNHAPSKLKHLSFQRIKEISQYNLLESDGLKVIIGILTDERIAVLNEYFEVHDNDKSVVLTFDEMMNYIVDDTYISPITEEPITKELFSQMTTTYFGVSNSFCQEVGYA